MPRAVPEKKKKVLHSEETKRDAVRRLHVDFNDNVLKASKSMGYTEASLKKWRAEYGASHEEQIEKIDEQLEGLQKMREELLAKERNNVHESAKAQLAKWKKLGLSKDEILKMLG